MRTQLSLESRSTLFALLTVSVALGSAWITAALIHSLAGTVTPSPVVVSMSPELIATGRNYFAMSCSHCHADDASGDEGPDLRNLTISNARIATTIKKGVKGEMPTFAKKYDDQQIAALVSYLRSLK